MRANCSGAASRRPSLTNRQIAERLVISERTAEGHVDHIRDKLGVHTRAEVAVWVAQAGLFPQP